MFSGPMRRVVTPVRSALYSICFPVKHQNCPLPFRNTVVRISEQGTWCGMNINGVVYSAPTENGEPKLGAFPRIWVARESFDIAGKPCHGSERIRSFDNTGKETYHHYICTYYIYLLTRYLPIIKKRVKKSKALQRFGIIPKAEALWGSGSDGNTYLFCSAYSDISHILGSSCNTIRISDISDRIAFQGCFNHRNGSRDDSL